MIILVYDQILFFEKSLKMSLIPPNKVRSSVSIGYDIPKKFMVDTNNLNSWGGPHN